MQVGSLLPLSLGATLAGCESSFPLKSADFSFPYLQSLPRGESQPHRGQSLTVLTNARVQQRRVQQNTMSCRVGQERGQQVGGC